MLKFLYLWYPMQGVGRYNWSQEVVGEEPLVEWPRHDASQDHARILDPLLKWVKALHGIVEVIVGRGHSEARRAQVVTDDRATQHSDDWWGIASTAVETSANALGPLERPNSAITILLGTLVDLDSNKHMAAYGWLYPVLHSILQAKYNIFRFSKNRTGEHSHCSQEQCIFQQSHAW
jgi:hypothetical protein